jgi:hypothetical protein
VEIAKIGVKRAITYGRLPPTLVKHEDNIGKMVVIDAETEESAVDRSENRSMVL